jgi:hypothetical protein
MEREIEYKGIVFDVQFDYQPEEPEVRYYADGSGYPGCPEQATLNEITHCGVSFMEFLEDEHESIVEKILKDLHDY